MDWCTFLLPATYTYYIRICRSFKVSPFILALTQTSSGKATVKPSSVELATEANIASPGYAGLKLIMLATHICQEANKNVRQAQSGEKKNYDRLVYFTPMFGVGDYVFLDRPPLFRSAANDGPRKGMISNYHRS